MEKKDRELDKLMAQKALGHVLYYEKNGAVREKLPTGQTRPLRPYSTDIAAAWEVAQKLGITSIPTEQGWFCFVGNQNSWKGPAEFLTCLQSADFMKSGAALAAQASTAICCAALKAIENRENVAAAAAEETNPVMN